MDKQAMLDQIKAISEAGTVERVYGQAQTIGDRMVIPVAEIHTCLGFGFGSGQPKQDEEGPQGEGGGGGGTVTARPVGVVEVTADGGASFLPIHAPMSVWKLLLAGLGVGMLLCMGSKCAAAHCRNGDRA